MISKVIIGKTFHGTCRYICRDQKRAVVLETNGVRGHDYKLMATDFISQQNFRPSVKNVVFHGILSLYPGEKISDDRMVEIAKEYLQEMGIVNTQYAITRHIDKNHPHLHIIANLIDNDGQVIKDNWIGLKGKKVSQKLTLKHELTPALTKNLGLTNFENLHEKEATRYVIYKAVSDTLPHCKNLNELQHLLEKRGIQTLYKYKAQTEELQGISFKMGEYKFKGSSIDRNYSLKNLHRAILSNEFKQHLHPVLTNLDMKNLRHQHLETLSRESKLESSKMITQVMTPERIPEQIPYELKKKRRRKFRGL